MSAMDFADYQPATRVLAMLRDITLAAVVGPSGAGKTTLVDAAVAQDSSLHMVVPETSRAPRPGEQHGVDYFFRTREEMLQHVAHGDYVVMPPVITGDLYASAPENYARAGVAVMAIWADAIPAFRAVPFKAMRTIFILPPSYEVWRSRLKGTRNALEKRLVEARRSFTFAATDEHALFVINDDLDTAIEDFITLGRGDTLSPRLQADQARGHQLAAALLRELDAQMLANR